MQCPTCGAGIPEGVNVCPDCGCELTSVQGAQAAPPSPPTTPSESASVPPVEAPPVAPVAPPAPTPTYTARLLLVRGGSPTGDVFSISGRVIIGKFDPSTGPVDIDLGHLPESGYVSRRHAEIYCDATGQWFVTDLGSTNGTYIKPSGNPQFQKLPENQPTPINDGDEVAFANARFIFKTK